MLMVIEGGDKVDRKLKAAGTTTGKAFVKRSLRETNKEVMLLAAKQSARDMVGGEMGKLIAKYLRARVFKKPRHGNALDVVDIGPRGNDDFVVIGKDDTRHYIPFAIEFGHGSVAAKPFFRNAWFASEAKAKRVLGKKLFAALLEEIKGTK